MTELKKKIKGSGESLMTTVEDVCREQRISFYQSAMNKAVSVRWKRFYWGKMRSEILNRSESQIAHMQARLGASL